MSTVLPTTFHLKLVNGTSRNDLDRGNQLSRRAARAAFNSPRTRVTQNRREQRVVNTFAYRSH